MEMSPPKIVKIHLNIKNQNHNIFPVKKIRAHKLQMNASQFSFSQEKDKHLKNNNVVVRKKKLSSKKMNSPLRFSPMKPHQLSIQQKNRLKMKQKKSRHYQQAKKDSEIFKKSIETLKSNYFTAQELYNIQQIQATRRVLMLIKRHAQIRQKDESSEKNKSLLSKFSTKSLNIEYYGFDDQKYNKFSEHKREPDNSIKDTQNPFKLQVQLRMKQVQKLNKNKQNNEQRFYKNFEQRYDKLLQEMPFELKSEQFVDKSSIDQGQFASPQNFQQLKVSKQSLEFGFQQITQDKIDKVLQIFNMCQKGQQSDELVLCDLNNLLIELQRRMAQKVQQKHPNKQQRILYKYSELLSQFQSIFRIIFYRKTRNNLYDILFYLFDENKLNTLCAIFESIKQLLDI